MGIVRKIAKNTLYLFIGDLVSKLAFFFLTIIIARFLGDVDLGKYSFAVSFHISRRTSAGLPPAAVISAGAGISRSHQNEIGRICPRPDGPADSYDAVFQRLAQGFQNIPGEFRKFVQEQNPAVCQRYFSRPGMGSAPD